MQTHIRQMLQTDYARQLTFFLSVIIGIGFLYSLVPTELTAVRGALAFAQFVMMAITMAATMQRVIEEF
jgi:hypothetical protein